MEELMQKLDKIMGKYFPTEEAREQAYSGIGEIVIFESLEIVLNKLENDEERDEFSGMVKTGNTVEAESYLLQKGIDFGEILENKAKEVLVDVLK